MIGAHSRSPLETASAQPSVAPVAVAFAVGDALIRVLYRAALKWAQTP